MVGLVVLLFPLLLMGFMLFMERVESPLRKVAVENQVEEFLDTARPDEVDTLVIEGLAVALHNWEDRRKRRGLTRLLPLSNRSNRANRSNRSGGSNQQHPRPAPARHRRG
ncbi:MAG TPA: hypothetical protein VIS06_14755 [Mycobacteriales bacterium]|jgi:hypothetical protein